MNIASRIPTEILGEIFLHTIDGPISNIQDNRFPWALNRVCKSWRFAFVTYPYLWTWITINLDESHSREQDLDPINKCLALCLERSRNYPLNISLHLPIEEDDENNPSFTIVWQTFLSCSHRWRIVYLANIPEPQFVTLNSCTGATSILESLTIHNPMDIIGYSDCTAFQIAPRLTRLTLRDLAAMFAVQRWSVPWVQLTNLVLRFEEIIGVDQLYALLKQLRDIEELRLILEGDEPGIDLDDFVHNSCTPQCLQHLRVLQVCCIEILGLITAPSLSELYLQGSDFFYTPTGDEDPYDFYEVAAEEIVSSFIQRSSCKIHKLTLSDFLQYLFTPLVELFPDVVELCLADALMCLQPLLSPNQLLALCVLDCTMDAARTKYFRETLLKILKLRNNSSAECSAVPLTKVIFRPQLEDGEESIPVTTVDWTSFESYFQVGSCCELNLPRHFLLPEKELPSLPPPATNGSPNTNVAPSPSSSTQGASLNPGPMVSQQPVVSNTLFPPDFIQHLNDGDINFERDFGQWFNGDDVPLDMVGGAPRNQGPAVSQQLVLPNTLFPPNFMQHMSNSLDDFDSNIFRNDGDINFERDFGQWFNGDDVPLDMK